MASGLPAGSVEADMVVEVVVTAPRATARYVYPFDRFDALAVRVRTEGWYCADPEGDARAGELSRAVEGFLAALADPQADFDRERLQRFVGAAGNHPEWYFHGLLGSSRWRRNPPDPVGVARYQSPWRNRGYQWRGGEDTVVFHDCYTLDGLRRMREIAVGAIRNYLAR